jgi:broad specificity phosphatase PhoE
MAMPDELVFVRHGHSEGNEASGRSKKGDNSFYTDEFRELPGSQWRLTAEGREQARATGAWIIKNIGSDFDAYYVSPYLRTWETAGLLDLPNADWRESQRLRERDYGDMGSMPKSEAGDAYPQNEMIRRTDPLYARPVNGESIADVRGNRLHSFNGTLSREQAGKRVIVVSHGEVMSAARAEYGYLSDEEWLAMREDPSREIHNAQVIEWTRLNPLTGKQGEYLGWTRESTPWLVGSETGVWRPIVRKRYTNEELLARVEAARPINLVKD